MRLHAILLLAAQMGAVVALVTRGLHRAYPALVLYLAGSIGQTLILLPFDPATEFYLAVWAWTLIPVMILQVGTAAECYRRSLEDDIPKAGRTSHYVVWSACLLIAAAAQYGQETRTVWGAVSRAQQAVAMVLATSSIAIAALIGLLRPHRSVTAIWHERILSVQLVSVAVLLFLLHRGHEWPGAANTLVSAACCVAWAILLQPEEKTTQPPPNEPSGPSGPDLIGIQRSLADALRRVFK